jgi:hypothetical protein
VSRTKPQTQEHARTRAGEWWVADEEPEVVSADRSERPSLPRWMRQRLVMLLGLAAAALFSAVLL